MQDPDCIFCKIASGKIPAKIMLQNKNTMALLDAFPLAAGHTLVIPRSHYAKLQDMKRPDAVALFEMTWQVVSAVEAGSQTSATTIAVHNGREAGQEIPHVHVHLIPRKPGDGAGPVHSMFGKRPKLGLEEMESLRSKIASNLK
jgi:histidine triad (HIT) family protein